MKTTSLRLTVIFLSFRVANLIFAGGNHDTHNWRDNKLYSNFNEVPRQWNAGENQDQKLPTVVLKKKIGSGIVRTEIVVLVNRFGILEEVARLNLLAVPKDIVWSMRENVFYIKTTASTKPEDALFSVPVQHLFFKPAQK